MFEGPRAIYGALGRRQSPGSFPTVSPSSEDGNGRVALSLSGRREMSALSQSRSTSNISRMRQLFEGGGNPTAPQPVPLSRCRSEVITTRGFRPSDIKDPSKTRILQDLTFKIWGRNIMEGSSGLQNGGPKPIDLQKLFTPASDADEIQPRNKKMFASSSFYGPNHPTMEEQVELARRISSSLSDISNKESKGQSMYVNRKKRSVKWVHQGEEQLGLSEFSEISHSENLPPTSKGGEKPILKLVMNPRGQVQDFNSLRGQAVDATPSPEVCFDLVKDLNSPCGKGAELFAKRRKKAESWVVDESNVKTSSELTSMSSYESNYSSQTSQMSQMQLGKLATPTFPPNMSSLPTLTYMKDIPARFAPTAAKNTIPDKYTQPKVRLIKSPWEAALEGSVDSAFLENKATAAPSPTPRGQVLIAPLPSSFNKMATPPPPQPYVPPQDLYTSKPPKAWHPQPTGKQFSGNTNSQPPPVNKDWIQVPTTPQQNSSSTPSNIHVDLSNVNNFNTAPRGWKSNMNVYKPITFSTLPTAQQFSDF